MVRLRPVASAVGADERRAARRGSRHDERGQVRLRLSVYAADAGHTIALPDPDVVVRRAPLLIRVGDRCVPALGVAMAATFRKTGLENLPLDRRGRALIGFASSGLQVVPLADVWT